MTTKIRSKSLWAVPSVLVFVAFLFQQQLNSQDLSQTAAEVAASPCAWVFDPTSGAFLTSDIYGVKTQGGQNCYAWQTFIGLNWPVDSSWPGTPANAGEPDRTATVDNWGVPANPDQAMDMITVWESYQAAADVFLSDASTPNDWGVVPTLPGQCGDGSVESVMVFRQLSKSVNPSRHRIAEIGLEAEFSNEISEAFGGWLTDQSQNLVYFNRRVGKAEFNYIVENQLYIASEQAKVATNADGNHPSGLSLPKGVFIRRAPSAPQSQEQLGAIEIKSAWRILTGQTTLYPRFLTTTAWLLNPDSGDCSQEVVGLVALHIIHKTESAPDFIWATFEQVDNAPIVSESSQSGPFSFNDPNCTQNCTPNQERIDCNDNGCTDLYPKDQPVQITRVNAIPDLLADVNTAAQNAIAGQTDGKSVFQYYKLVNVLWDPTHSLAPANEPGPSAEVPLNYDPFTSQGNIPVANTVLETYIQNSSCDVCHKLATIAGSDTLASDFSFLFETASNPPSAP